MPFKKHIALLLVGFLMFSNIGLALNVHFCGDTKVASTFTYVKIEEELCQHEESEENHEEHEEEDSLVENTCCSLSDNHADCCTDEYIAQEKTDVIVKPFSFDIAVFVVAEILSPVFNHVVCLAKTQEQFFECNANDPPLYKQYCSLLFYA